MKQQLSLLIKKLKDCKLDGMLVSSEANVSYLSGFKNSQSYCLISHSGCYFITDFRYTQEARKNIKGFKIIEYKNLFKDTAWLINKLKLKKLGFESKDLSFAEYSKFKQYTSPKTKLTETFNFIEHLRQIKNKEEIKNITNAIAITSEAFKFLRNYLKTGQTELQIAAEIERFVRYQGAYDTAFNIIVTSGPNSCFPHATISNRKIRAGEPILIDIGVSINGYKSDLTRVFFLDRIPITVRKVYDIIVSAQNKAFQTIRPFVQINEIDSISRKYIEAQGFGSYFGHSLGHGIGLEVHEEPSISGKNTSLARPGMIFTIEPGIYLPGKFGIRLEDMVLVTEKGVKVLSGAIDKSI